MPSNNIFVELHKADFRRRKNEKFMMFVEEM